MPGLLGLASEEAGQALGGLGGVGSEETSRGLQNYEIKQQKIASVGSLAGRIAGEYVGSKLGPDAQKQAAQQDHSSMLFGSLLKHVGGWFNPPPAVGVHQGYNQDDGLVTTPQPD